MLRMKAKLKSEVSFQQGSALFLEAVIRRSSVKKAFLKISQNSQENTCARVSLSTYDL